MRPLDFTPGEKERADRRLQWLALAIAVLAILARIWVEWTTHSTAEDFLISLRYAENLAAGRGFVFNPGAHVLGTTTPLYTLLLALAAWLHLHAVLTGKALNILADGGTCYLLARLLARPEIRQPVAGLFAATLYAFSSTPINISISGMETALVTCVCLAAILAYIARRSLALYVLGALLFLLRIDGLLLFALLALGLALQERRIPWRDLVLAVLLVLPWVIFAIVYFGSPIPTSFIAKITVYAHGVTPAWVNKPAFVTQFLGGWFQTLLTLLFLLGSACICVSVYQLLAPKMNHPLASLARDTEAQRKDKEEKNEKEEADARSQADTAALSEGRTQRKTDSPSPYEGEGAGGEVLFVPLLWLLIYYGTMLTSHVPAFAWYFLPPWPVYLGIAALGTSWIVSRIGRELSDSAVRPLRRAWAPALLLFGLFGVAHLPSIRRDIARTQRQEDSLRVPIGLWLRAHAGLNETILLEPIGYVGYYSRRPILDMIGLVSPEVLPSYRTSRALYDIIRRLHPDWLCLRPGEVQVLKREGMPLPNATYAYVREFHVPGRRPDFLLFHRRPPIPIKPSSSSGKKHNGEMLLLSEGF